MNQAPEVERPAHTGRTSDRRESRINRDRDGNVIGAMLFVTGEELAEIGVELADADTVEVRVEEGELVVE